MFNMFDSAYVYSLFDFILTFSFNYLFLRLYYYVKTFELPLSTKCATSIKLPCHVFSPPHVINSESVTYRHTAGKMRLSNC